MATPTSNSVPVTAVNPASTGAGIYLVEGHKWGGVLGTAVTLTYSFPTGTAYFIDPYSSDSPNDEWSSWSPVTSGERDAIRDVLDTWSSFAGISFVEVADNASIVGELRFTYTENIDPDFAAHAYYPSNHPSAGDVWFSWVDFNPDGNATVPPGTFDYHTILHEVGHALGLKHPFEAPNVIPDALDNYFYTVMSYTASPWSDEGDSYSSFAPTTPMYYDLLAIQALYGRNTTVNGGNTTYTFNDGTYYWEAINDGGGHDIIVYNGSEDSSIDLSPGAFSELSEAIFFSDGINSRATVTIGPNVVIEDARGGSGHDTFRGNNGANVLSGGNGNDTFHAWDGADTFNGDAGTDTLSFIDWIWSVTVDLSLTTAQTILGGSLKLSSIENVIGSSVNDVLRGSNAANVLSGGSGNDTFRAWAGADTFNGDAGTDTLSFADWSWSVAIDLGIATSQTILGGSLALSSIENMVGSSVNDVLRGSNGANVLSGGGGNDTFRAWAGADTFNGDAGTDTLSFVGWGPGVSIDLSVATAQAVSGGSLKLSSIENVIGGNGADTFRGSNGANVLSGGGGNDTFRAWAGHDTFNGDAGIDTLSFAGWTWSVTVDLSLTTAQTILGGSLKLSSIENVIGSSVNDILRGSNGANVLSGGGGNDTFRAWAGADTFNGDAGTDTLSFAGWTWSVTVDLSLTTAQTILGGSLKLSSIENMVGSSVNDILKGSNGANVLSGGGGNDTLTGRLGSDTFVFNTALNAASNVDTITDFDVLQDTMQIDNAVMAGLGLTLGTLAAAGFWASLTGLAHDADDRITYETDTGKLFYDADGNGALAAVQFATLATNLALSNQDFFVI